jgi:dihydrofolate reductase
MHTLLANELVDELRLMIDPIVLGGGKRIVADDGTRSSWRLAESEVTATGAILATYIRA